MYLVIDLANKIVVIDDLKAYQVQSQELTANGSNTNDVDISRLKKNPKTNQHMVPLHCSTYRNT